MPLGCSTIIGGNFTLKFNGSHIVITTWWKGNIINSLSWCTSCWSFIHIYWQGARKLSKIGKLGSVRTRLMDFNGISIYLEISYAKRLRSCNCIMVHLYLHFLSNCFLRVFLHIWYQVFLSHTNNLYTVVWFQVFLFDTNNYIVSSHYFYLIIVISLNKVSLYISLHKVLSN